MMKVVSFLIKILKYKVLSFLVSNFDILADSLQHSAVIMRCIPKEKNREEEITCSVLHFEKIRAVHPSVFPVESVRSIARSILKSARS